MKGSVNQSDRWCITKSYFDKDNKHRRVWNWEETKDFTGGVSSIIEWQRDIVPEPPYIIRLFCEASGIFKDPMTVYRLKPMIFSYWC